MQPRAKISASGTHAFATSKSLNLDLLDFRFGAEVATAGDSTRNRYGNRVGRAEASDPPGIALQTLNSQTHDPLNVKSIQFVTPCPVGLPWHTTSHWKDTFRPQRPWLVGTCHPRVMLRLQPAVAIGAIA